MYREINVYNKDLKDTLKILHNQIRKRYLEDINNQKEKPMKVIMTYNVPILVVPEEKHSSKQKMIFSGTMELNPKRKIQLPEEIVN